MGEMIIDVTRLEKKTRLSLCFSAPNRTLKRFIERTLLAASNPDVQLLEDDVWAKIVWYYDGGSDGSEEYEAHNKRVIQYFNNLNSRLENAS